MSSPRTSTSAPRGRRSTSRSTRTLVAVLLLATAVAAAVAAIVVATQAALALGVVYVVVTSTVAARLLSDETASVRRDWARDRAGIAHHQTRQATVRMREQVAFAEQMAAKVRSGRDEAERLAAELEAARTALVDAESAHREAVDRGQALESELGTVKATLLELRTELRRVRDELAISQSAEVEARTELVAWQQAEVQEPRRYA